MYEDMTFENIMGRCLSKVPSNIDKREGSIIYDALAPAAAEMAIIYIEIEYLLNRSFVDTATGDDLTKRCAERGIVRAKASSAIRKGVFAQADGSACNIENGSRFSGGNLNFTAAGLIAPGQYKLTCETKGASGNNYYGALLPIDYIPKLATATLEDIIMPGEEEEGDDRLRKRYYDSLNAQAFGGNATDYRERVNALDGVGGVKVYPVWAGGGTVKLVIIDAAYGVPAGNLTDAVQAAVDPVGSQGQGAGIAPIGHVVTVQGVTGTTINIKTTLTYRDDWTWEDVRPYVEQEIDTYFGELARDWADIEHIVVRISQIETRLLGLTGILDIADTSINGRAQNLELGPDSIPVRGTING